MGKRSKVFRDKDLRSKIKKRDWNKGQKRGRTNKQIGSQKHRMDSLS